MKAHSTKCPTCGRPMVGLRFSVWLGPIQARIVDTIEHAGEEGISRRNLARVIYADRPVTHAAISQHVHKINSELVSTDYRIGRVGRNYRIVRIRSEAA